MAASSTGIWHPTGQEATMGVTGIYSATFKLAHYPGPARPGCGQARRGCGSAARRPRPARPRPDDGKADEDHAASAALRFEVELASLDRLERVRHGGPGEGVGG